MKFSEKVVMKKYRVLKPFIHFEKDDIINLVLKLNYNFKSGSWSDRAINVQSNLIAEAYETQLPYTALLDEDFLSEDHLPYLLSDFLKYCGVDDVENVSSSLNYDMKEAEFGIERVKDYLTEIWFNTIKIKRALEEYKSKRKYK